MIIYGFMRGRYYAITMWLLWDNYVIPNSTLAHPLLISIPIRVSRLPSPLNEGSEGNLNKQHFFYFGQVKEFSRSSQGCLSVE